MNASGIEGWRLVWDFSRPYRGPLLLGGLLTTITVALALLAPWPIVLVVDHGIIGRPLPEWLGFLESLSRIDLVTIGAGGSIALVAAGAWIGYLATLINGSAQARIGSDIRTVTFGKLQRAPLAFHETQRTGDVLTRLTSDVAHVEDMVVAWYDTVLPETLTLLGVLGVLAFVSPPFFVVALLALPPLAWWLRRAHRSVYGAELAAREKSGTLLDQAGDVLGNQRAVQVFSRQHAETERFGTSSSAAAASEIVALERSARVEPVVQTLLAVASAAVLYFGALEVIRGRLTLGIMLVLLTYVAEVYGPIESLAMLVTTMARGAASRDRIAELLEGAHPAAPGGDRTVDDVDPRSLVVRDVAFGYSGDPPRLRNIHFRVDRGEWVAIVGPSGAGKSSLISLLVRLYDPRQGSITWDGVDLRDFDVDSLRAAIAVVPQDCWLMNGTIAENIAMGLPGASPESIEAAARLAGAHDFIVAHPAGYDTMVGPAGVVLSGGQRRMLSLARALVRPSRLLIVDEPTTGLDKESAARIIATLKTIAADRAVIVVSHDLMLAAGCDRIYVIADGSTVETGRHEMLLRSGGRYLAMWRAQTSNGSSERGKTDDGGATLPVAGSDPRVVAADGPASPETREEVRAY